MRRSARELFGEHAPEAKAVILDIMRNGTSEVARLRAAEVVLERVYGRVPEPAQDMATRVDLPDIVNLGEDDSAETPANYPDDHVEH